MGSGLSMALGDIGHWRGKGQFVDDDCGANGGDGSIGSLWGAFLPSMIAGVGRVRVRRGGRSINSS